MIALFAALALASPDQTHTAETLDAGEVVVRFPTGPSAVGVAGRTELWLTPLDVGIGGPRIGVEQALVDGERLGWSLRPSLGLKSTARRASVRVETVGSYRLGEHRLSASLAADVRIQSRLDLDKERSAALSIDRVQVPFTAIWDWTRGRSTVRSRVNLPLRDRGRTLAYGSGSLSYLHDFGKVHTETGVGLLVGRPRDQYLLDTYHWFFVVPFPKLDVWLAF